VTTAPNQFSIFFRHGRARPGHPRLASAPLLKKKDMDARHKAGHDGGWVAD